MSEVRLLAGRSLLRLPRRTGLTLKGHVYIAACLLSTPQQAKSPYHISRRIGIPHV